MSLVLVDTVALLALWDASDQWHRDAVAASLTLARTPARIVTTSLVLLECGNAAARKPYRDQVPALWERLDAERRLIVPTSADIETAWADYRRGGAGDAGIVDHVSFTMMRRLGIRDAFTNDRHFAAAGFRTLF